VSDLENRRKKIVGEPDEGEPHVRFDVAGDGQPGYGNGTEALSEEMERNGSALPTFLAPSPDPTSNKYQLTPLRSGVVKEHRKGFEWH
jgi:hypothetical protein